MSESDPRSNGDAVGYESPHAVGVWHPPMGSHADTPPTEPHDAPVTEPVPDGGTPTDARHTSEPDAAPEPVRDPEPLESPEKLARHDENRVARLLARRQDVLTGRASASWVSADEVTPAVPADGPDFRRALPVSIYLESDENKVATRDALLAVLTAFDIEVTHGWPEIRGSSFRSFLARTRKRLNSREFRTRLAKIERAVELQALHKAQAEVDAAQGDAVAKLITALGSSPTAMIQIGSVLLMKVDGTVIVRNLTQLELVHLERNPALLRAPADALHELQQLNAAAHAEQSLPYRVAQT